MLANYHSHTTRCRHASGTEREYIEKAIKVGYKIFGFSDHTPYFFKDKHEPDCRMYLEETKDYFDTVRSLAEEYKDKIKILVGLECEYYPGEDFKKTMDFIMSFKPDYLILGQHRLHSDTGISTFSRTYDPNVLREYVDEVIEGMKQGFFAYLAHPDCINFLGDMDVYEKEMTRLSKAAKELNMPLEINLNGIALNRNYPTEKFWEIAGKIGNEVIIGSDCHTVKGVEFAHTIDAAMHLVNKYNLNLIEEIKLLKY